VSLGVGFVLPAGGYVALIVGASVQTGAVRAVLAVGIAAVAALAWWWRVGHVHSRLVKCLVVNVARANPVSGELGEHPDAGVLLALGQELGFLLTEAPAPVNPGVPRQIRPRILCAESARCDLRDASEDDAAACAAIYAPYVRETAVSFE
jgi:hypothetical protein